MVPVDVHVVRGVRWRTRQGDLDGLFALGANLTLRGPRHAAALWRTIAHEWLVAVWWQSADILRVAGLQRQAAAATTGHLWTWADALPVIAGPVAATGVGTGGPIRLVDDPARSVRAGGVLAHRGCWAGAYIVPAALLTGATAAGLTGGTGTGYATGAAYGVGDATRATELEALVTRAGAARAGRIGRADLATRAAVIVVVTCVLARPATTGLVRRTPG